MVSFFQLALESLPCPTDNASVKSMLIQAESRVRTLEKQLAAAEAAVAFDVSSNQ